MPELVEAIDSIRNAVTAVLRIHLLRPQKRTQKRVRPAQYNKPRTSEHDLF